MGKKIIILLLFHIVSIILLIIAFILILIQNINNIIFCSENNKNITTEKLIYEQFSHEIYSNIKSKIFYDIKNIPINDKCENGSLIKFPVRIESFYDCEGVYNDIIDYNECQNRITNPSYCCEPNCCRDYVINKERYHFCSENKNFSAHDPRSDICSNISIYNGKFYCVNHTKYCAKRFSKSYEELLSGFDKNKNCDILFDTAGHYFCSSDYNLSIPNDIPIAQNVFSVVPPSFFNIEKSFRITLLLNKKKDEEQKILEEMKKLKEISTKNMEEVFKHSGDDFPNYYKQYKIFNLDNLISGDEPVFERFKSNSFLKTGKITWYTRNYIGFKDIKELKKFKKYFDENDYKNNSLYKISTSTLIFGISITSIIIICLLFVLTIFLIIYYAYIFNKNQNLTAKEVSGKMGLTFLIISSLSFVFFLIIYLACFIYKFDNIEINMEIFFQRVIEKYMERRKQLYLLIGFILLAVNVLLYALNMVISKFTFKSKKVVNSRPNNILLIKFRLNEGNCEHAIKVDNNKNLDNYIKTFDKILEKCGNCSDDYLGMEKILLDNKELDIRREIKSLGIRDNSVLIIDDNS